MTYTALDNKLASDMLKYRAVNNISQRELARRCNVTVQTILNIEKGKQNPSMLTETKIRLVIGENNYDG